MIVSPSVRRLWRYVALAYVTVLVLVVQVVLDARRSKQDS